MIMEEMDDGCDVEKDLLHRLESRLESIVL